MDEVNAVTDYATVKTMDHDAAVAAGLYHTMGKEIDDQYMATIRPWFWITTPSPKPPA
ncbi:MAG: hypothetical protein ACLU9S_18255 [Oscillospiraceae bacterium]